MTQPPPLYGGYRDPKAQLAAILSGKHDKRVVVKRPKQEGPSGHLAEPLVIEFPLPPKELSPNHTHNSHWTRTNKAKRKYQEAVAMLCKIKQVPVLLLDTAIVQATFYFPTAARRDRDNTDASLKSLWDVLVQHGLFRDDYGLRHDEIVIAKDRENPRLVVSVRS